MPLARISVPFSLPMHKITALADAVHHGLVATCNVPDKDRFQIISAVPDGMLMIDPTFPNVQRSSEASIVEILFLAGRSIAQKRQLFRMVAELAIAAGFRGDDIMMALSENAVSDWSLGHGRMFDKHHAPASS